MTVDIRVILLVFLLALAGCMPAKKVQGPAAAEPAVPAVASQDAGEVQGPEACPPSGGENQEASLQNGGDEEFDVLPDREEIPEADALTTEEQKILDTELSFHVGLDTEENADVQRYFHFYTHVQRGTMENWIKRAQRYLPYVRSRFLAEGLPEDLAYLPFAESGFNPFAVSSAGAAGIWQFMPRTGAIYGLRVDSWVDERRNPYKSTEAAIKYLKKLHEMFDDWALALAAYNAGEGAIGRALKKTGCEDYFSLCENSEDLKLETKRYVPKFLALVKVARNLEALGFQTIDMNSRPASTVKVKAKPGTDLLALSREMGMDWKSFRELNPELRQQEAPSSRSLYVSVPGHLLAKAQDYVKRPVVPKAVEYATYRVKPGDTWWGVSKRFGVSVKSLQKSNTVKKLSVGQILNVPGVPSTGDIEVAGEAKVWAAKRANYVVRSGDTVWSIAREFKTDPNSLLKSNGLDRSAVLKVGQKLFVPDAGSEETKAAQTQAESVRQELISYQVRPGDSLWNIAKRFGVTTGDLRSWNKLAENGNIRPGDQLKVYSR